MQNLERRPSGIYVARLTIPIRLRSIVGATAFIASTGTPQLAMAKLIASELLAGWRRHLFELERFALAGTSMNDQSIIKIADGHPLLRSMAYFPVREAASLLGLQIEDILRQVGSSSALILHQNILQLVVHPARLRV
ncbi:MAG: hypothetical protein EOO28_17915 [Comamonadaceae bacterium]|nr:MAG: hypothetical protein EOO28_17915 [Comamonadaceae bacterium]